MHQLINRSNQIMTFNNILDCYIMLNHISYIYDKLFIIIISYYNNYLNIIYMDNKFVNNRFISNKQSIIKSVGEIPVLILSYHDGYINIKCKEKREIYSNTFVRNDRNTLEISIGLIDELEKLNIKPYILISLVKRRNVDINRTSSTGCNNSCPKTIEFHKYFHNELDNLVDDSIKRFGKCLIFDIHGSHLEDMVHLGFNVSLQGLIKNNLYKSSIKSIVNTNNYRYIYGNKSIFKYMEKGLSDIKIFPNSGKNLNLELLEPYNYLYFNGSYIAKKYHKICDYIQIELPINLRTENMKTSYLMAKVINDYYNNVYKFFPAY
jgi:hypothetical protein